MNKSIPIKKVLEACEACEAISQMIIDANFGIETPIEQIEATLLKFKSLLIETVGPKEGRKIFSILLTKFPNQEDK